MALLTSGFFFSLRGTSILGHLRVAPQVFLPLKRESSFIYSKNFEKYVGKNLENKKRVLVYDVVDFSGNQIAFGLFSFFPGL